MERGKFIAFEGLDCSGKTTQLEMLVERLSKTMDIAKFANISDGPIGKLIRQLTHDKDFAFANSSQIACLYLAELHQVSHEIDKTLNEGKHVICSRHILSPLVYAADTVNIEHGIHSMCRGMCMPDINIFIEVSMNTVSRRLGEKTNPDYWEKMEDQNVFQQRYVDHIRNISHVFNVPTVGINGDRDAEIVHEDVVEFVYDYFKWGEVK